MPSPQSRTAIEPLQRKPSARFIIGKDQSGHWIVEDRDGIVGGVFISEQAALHFAADECGHDAEQICRAADGIVLRLGMLGGNNIH